MKVKLFYPPKYYDDHPLGPTLALVPLVSLPVLKAYLTLKGHLAEQDDLDVKVYSDNKKEDPRQWVDMSLFSDRERIRAFLREGHSLELEEEGRRILAKADYRGFDVVGFSVTNEWNFSGVGTLLVMAKLIREETGAVIAVGGSDVRCMFDWLRAEEILQYVDMICLAPHHYEFHDVLSALEGAIPGETRVPAEQHLCTDSYSEVRPAVMFGPRLEPLKEKVHFTSHTRMLELPEEHFPTPDFEGLPLDLYGFIPEDIRTHFGIEEKILILPYYFMQGCPNRCIFCRSTGKDTVPFFHKKPKLVAKDLAKFSEKYDTRFFMFLDTNVNATRENLGDLLSAMEEAHLDLVWSDCANFGRMGVEDLRTLHKAGVRRLIFGLESPSPRLLEYVEKKTTIEHAEELLKASSEIGIWNEVELICGLPHETEADVLETIDFVNRSREYVDSIHLHRFKLLESKLSQEPEKYGICNIREKPNPTYPGRAFDEINGLAWEEKEKQIEDSFQRVTMAIQSLPPTGYTNRDQSFMRLFYLYGIMDDKEKIKSYIRENPYSY